MEVSKNWKWMPGMLTEYEGRVVAVDGLAIQCTKAGFVMWFGSHEVGEPDYTDPATVGCLFAQFCERAEDRGWEGVILQSGGAVKWEELEGFGKGGRWVERYALDIQAALDAAKEDQ